MLTKSDLTKAQLEFAERFTLLHNICRMDMRIKVDYYLRPDREQAVLYRRGRNLEKIEAKAEELSDVYGRCDLAFMLIDVGPQMETKRVTNAAPGQSLHNYALAGDVYPMRGGKLIFNDNALWERIGNVAEVCKLKWGGNWKMFQDKAHVQHPGYRWQDLIRL